MNFHRLRLITFNKSRSPTRTPSRTLSKLNEENVKVNKCPSSKKVEPYEHLFKKESAKKCPTIICNRVETERIPLPRRSKSETFNFSFTKILGNLGHRKTTSLSDIKKRLTKCSKMCTERIRQTLHMFTLKGDSQVDINHNSGDNIRSKQVETILSAPNLDSQRKRSLPIKENINFASSSNKFRSYQKNVSLFGLYSCLKDINKNKSSGKLRRIRRKKSSAEPDNFNKIQKSASLKVRKSKRHIKSESSVFHYNLVSFPSTSKRSKHLKIYQSRNDNSIKTRTPRTVDKPVSAASIPKLAHLDHELKCSSFSLYKKEEKYNPIPEGDVAARVVHTDNKKPSHLVYSAAMIQNNRKPSMNPLITKNERKSRKILKSVVLCIILLVWSPCMITIWISWCLTHPFRSQDVASNKYKDECGPYDDTEMKMDRPNSKLLYFCCGWTRLISSILTKFDPQNDLQNSSGYLTPDIILSRALLKFSGSFTRRPNYSMKSSKRNIYPQNIQNMHCKVNQRVIQSGVRKSGIKTGDNHQEVKKCTNINHRRPNLESVRYQKCTCKDSQKKPQIGFNHPIVANCSGQKCSKMYVERGNVPTYTPVQRYSTGQRSIHNCKTYRNKDSKNASDILNVSICYPDEATKRANKSRSHHICKCGKAGRDRKLQGPVIQNDENRSVSDHLIKNLMSDVCPECTTRKTLKAPSRTQAPECQGKTNLPGTQGVIHSQSSRGERGCTDPKRDSCKPSFSESCPPCEIGSSGNKVQTKTKLEQKAKGQTISSCPPADPCSPTTKHKQKKKKQSDSPCPPADPCSPTPNDKQKKKKQSDSPCPPADPCSPADSCPPTPKDNQKKKKQSVSPCPPANTCPPNTNTTPKNLPPPKKQKKKDCQHLPVDTLSPNTCKTTRPCKYARLKAQCSRRASSAGSAFCKWLQKITTRRDEKMEMDCNKLFLSSLRKRPCYTCFKHCPTCYPYFLTCRQCCFNSWDQCVCCIAACIYSPLLVLCYICGALFCQISNAW